MVQLLKQIIGSEVKYWDDLLRVAHQLGVQFPIQLAEVRAVDVQKRSLQHTDLHRFVCKFKHSGMGIRLILVHAYANNDHIAKEYELGAGCGQTGMDIHS